MAKQIITLDLTQFFRKEAPKIISSYKRLMTMKRGILQDSAPSNAPSTIRKKGKNHWLIDTGETKSKGFDYRVSATRLLIFGSGRRHSGQYTQMLVPEGSKRARGQSRIPTRKVIRQRTGTPPTYRQIFRWHNKQGYSGIFGQLPKGSRFYKRMWVEAHAQIKLQAGKILPKRIKLRLKA